MADITSRDFQELIKRQKETTDSLQTIIQQNEKAGTPSERFLDNAAEILSINEVDGFLIGSASLNADKFYNIYNKF